MNLHEFAFSGAALQNVGDGDGCVAVGEVRIVSAAGDGDAEAVAGDTAQRYVVQLPGDSFTPLHKENSIK